MDRRDGASLDRAARVAGVMFLLSLLVPLLGWMLLSPLVVHGNALETGRNVLGREAVFRAAILIELATCVVVVMLASALYELVAPIERRIASLALSLKLIEAALWAVIGLAHVAALGALTSQATLAPGQVQTLVGLLLGAHMPVTAFPGILLGIGMVLFLSLLATSGHVPRALAGFGVLSYALVFLYDSLLVVSPSWAANVWVQVVGWGPSVVFELVIGPWLLVKGAAATRPAGAAV